jgi:hypothetical protein
MVGLMRQRQQESDVTHSPQKLKRVTLSIAVTIALAVAVAVVTLAPVPAGGPAGSDKLYHVLAFAGLAFPLSLIKPRWTICGFREVPDSNYGKSRTRISVSPGQGFP